MDPPYREKNYGSSLLPGKKKTYVTYVDTHGKGPFFYF